MHDDALDPMNQLNRPFGIVWLHRLSPTAIEDRNCRSDARRWRNFLARHEVNEHVDRALGKASRQ
ncbi:hypothetical protein [Bradyrhizobium cytisi]|uniref:hypothetical protein n=1 Tax=Bradyrhizobium cytisi TaxID=515489 RepID=UPI001652C7C1